MVYEPWKKSRTVNLGRSPWAGMPCDTLQTNRNETLLPTSLFRLKKKPEILQAFLLLEKSYPPLKDTAGPN